LEDAGVSKLIRFDEDHFGYLLNERVRAEEAQRMSDAFRANYDGKCLLIMQADEFIDLTGQYEIVEVGSPGECPFCHNTVNVSDVIAGTVPGV
jgi:hypothetical protein